MKKKQKIVLIVLVAVVVILIFCYLLLPKFSKDNVGIYYKKSDGTYATNEWVKRFSDWYYFDGNGYMVKGQITPDEYYTDYKTGKLMKNYWLSVNGKYYYFDENGKFTRDRWIEYKNNYFYITPTGDMATNRWINNEFYVGQDGAMLVNTTTPDGNTVGSDGKAINKVVQEKNNSTKNTMDLYRELFPIVLNSVPNGYQLYDVNNDGIDEMFVYGKPNKYKFTFIDRAYGIENGKAVIFNIGTQVSQWGKAGDGFVYTECDTGATRDEIWYALEDGRLALFDYHWGALNNIFIINPKNKEKEILNYEVTEKSDVNSGWSYNNQSISEVEAEEKILEILDKIGYFSNCEVRHNDF